jgi:hypothetical protein
VPFGQNAVSYVASLLAAAINMGDLPTSKNYWAQTSNVNVSSLNFVRVDSLNSFASLDGTAEVVDD